MNKINFYPKDNININDLIDTFCDFIKKNLHKVEIEEDKDLNHEFEITLYRPDIIRVLSSLNHMVSQLNNDKYYKESYVEKIIKFKEDLSDKEDDKPLIKEGKHRSKIPWNVLETIKLRNKTISSTDFGTWETKTLKESIQYKEPDNLVHYDIKYSTEKKNVKTHSSDYLTEKHLIKLFSINSISIVYKNIKISMREKVILGSGHKDIAAFHKHLLNIEFLPKNTTWYIELEYVGNFENINFVELKDNLSDCFALIYGTSNINNIMLLKSKVPTILKTNFITTEELFQKNENEILLTTKIDGDKVDFKVKNSICYMILGNIIYLLKTDIDSKISFEGIGEYVKIDGKRIIYPFYFRKINERLVSNREKAFKVYKKIIKKDKDFKISSDIDSDIITVDKNADYPDINFKSKKIYGPFISKEDYMMNVYNAFNENTIYEKDGIIIMNKDNNDFPTDEKFKQDNTVDVVAQIKPNIIQKKDGRYIEVKMYKFNKKNQEDFKTEYIKNNENFRFDDILSYVIMKNNKTNNPKFYMCPYTIIFEYSLLYNKIIQPRLEKTNNFYYNGYMGNNYNVIVRSEMMHNLNKVLPIDVFKELGKNFKLDKLYNININEDNYLNFGKTGYFVETKKRSSLNFITNFVKTQAILNYFSPLLKKEEYNKSNDNYLSIDIGRGGDLQRYFYVNANSVTGTDPDAAALEECNKRYITSIRGSRSTPYSLNLKRIYFNDKDYISKVTENGITKFSGIDWNMAIHYSLKKNKYIEISKKLNDLLKVGGRILITTLDGEKVKQSFENKGTEKLKFNIDEVEMTFVKSVDTEENEILKVFISSMTAESKDEYLVNIDNLISAFESNKLMLLDYYHFDIVKNYYENFELLTIMRNEKEQSKHFFFKNLLHAKMQTGSDLETLSSLYVSLVFEKM